VNADGGFSDRPGWLSNANATYYALDALDVLGALNTIAADWDRVRGLLPDRPYRAGDPRVLSWRRALRRPTAANIRYRAGQVLRHGPTRALVERVYDDAAFVERLANRDVGEDHAADISAAM